MSLQASTTRRSYVTSKDGFRTVLVDLTDDLHALTWGRLMVSNRSARPAHLLTYEEAKAWIERERSAGDDAYKAERLNRIVAASAGRTERAA